MEKTKSGKAEHSRADDPTLPNWKADTYIDLGELTKWKHQNQEHN